MSGVVSLSAQEGCSSFVTAYAPVTYYYMLLKEEEIVFSVVVAEVAVG